MINQLEIKSFICHNAKKELCAPNGIVGSLATLKGRICICAASLSIMILICQNLVVFSSNLSTVYATMDDKSARNQIFYLPLG